MRKRLKKRSRQLWPRPVAQFVIGELEEAELLRLARVEEPMAGRRLCQAEFYAAVQARVRADRVREASAFVAGVEHGAPVPLEIEFYLAQHELTAGSGPSRQVHVPRIDDHLHDVTLTNDDQRYGTSWSDWSRAKEDERRSSHDAWLQQKLGDVKRFWPWGDVTSGFDDKGGFSRIVLRYRDLETCQPAGTRTSWLRGIRAR